jgi:hypothetical protein
MPTFVPGIELSRYFYFEIVRPLLNENFPGLAYAAALLGPGSETLGFDTEMSVDHDWGARLFIFLKEADTNYKKAIVDLMSQRLPATFRGFPVHLPNGPFEPRTQTWKLAASGPVNHLVIPITVRDFVRIQLGYDLVQPLQAADWLTFPSHSLGELVAGAVYYDATGEITQVRERFAWYPHDVWLYLLAAGWQRIGQEEHLMPRAGSVGDELGSALIGSRLIRDAMRLAFLMEKRYAPYPKWFGTAFKRLEAARELEPGLWQAHQAQSWQQRESALSRVYEALARMHNSLHLTKPLPEAVSPFYDRPFQVIHGEQFAQALVEQITDPEVKRIAGLRLIGSIDQWSDNTDMEGLDRLKLRQLYSV